MEKIYHYLWQSKMFGRKLTDNFGNVIEVLDPGNHNQDAGPDFFNSKIKIDEVEWVGNIEIHVKSSDWYRHGHHKDPAYDNVLLHVVGINDAEIKRRDGNIIPQVVITFPEGFYRTLLLLSADMDNIRCASCIPSIPELNKTDWLETLAIERIHSKVNHILEILKKNDGDWEQTCFILLARALGFGVNSDAFELLARSVSIKILHHHQDNPLQLQAILLGQAGMLDSSLYIFDDYYQTLCREYYFLAIKYQLRPLSHSIWKYSRMRPQNFPHRRIILLSKLCEDGFSIFSKILQSEKDPESLSQLFKFYIDDYWQTHFSFDLEATNAPARLSQTSINLLIINMVAPIIYAYAKTTGDLELSEKAFNILEYMPPENNKIIRQWESVGLKPLNGRGSQALIELKKNYCDTRKCLYCRFGTYFLRTSSLS